MRGQSFAKTAPRLLYLLTNTLDCAQEDDLRIFYEAALRAIQRTDSMRRDENGTPGYEEWCEFRALVHVGWSIYWDACWDTSKKNVKRYFPNPRETYRPDAGVAKELLWEVVGTLPRRSHERWMSQMEEASRWGSREAKTVEEYHKVMGDLLREDTLHPEPYKLLYHKLLAEYRASGQIKD